MTLNLVDPAEVGLSADRLAKLAAHLDGYVDSGKYPFVSVLVARYGQPAFLHLHGLSDHAAGKPVTEDSIVRIYSMSKPITTVAAMMLYEEAKFRLDEPVAKYIPSLAKPNMLIGGSAASPQLAPASRDYTIQELMTHTAGLTYGFEDNGLVAEMYNKAGLATQGADYDLAEFCRILGGLPLIGEPGARWNYSVATDVLGHLVEVVSGQSLNQFMSERIFGPLGMTDTDFHVPAEKLDRFGECYEAAPDGGKTLFDSPKTSWYQRPPPACSGGGGLVSTIGDYHRFAQMLLNGGELDGARLLGPRTVEFMTSNHLPGDRDLAAMGQAVFSEVSYDGIGFGLGVHVVLDPPAAHVLTTAGEYGWGGMASTVWWNNPAEDLSLIMLTQLRPSSTYPVRPELRALLHSAIID